MPKKQPPKLGGMAGQAQGNLGGRRAQLDAAIDAQTGYKPKPKPSPAAEMDAARDRAFGTPRQNKRAKPYK